MQKILLVEDSKSICTFLLKKISQKSNYIVDVANTFEKAKEMVEDSDYFLAILDIHLPDVSDTTMVNFMLEKNIPSIVMTSDFDENTYQSFSKLNIIDYVLKESPESLNYVVSLVDRIYSNSKIKVLIIDDSVTVRNRLRYFLQSQMFEVLSASEPLEAFETIEKNSDIKIIITDYYMPNLNGVEFLKIIRRNFSKNKIAVVGISSDESSSILFLKNGANDFVTKPFVREEFICRINNTAESLENVTKLEEIANRDFLTKVANRKYFFEKAQKYFQEARKDGKSNAIAMLDIDNFKLINDTYGHGVGDEVIKSLANTLSENIKGQDIVARFGGEEFVLFIKDITPAAASKFLQSICKKIAESTIMINEDIKINFTVSIGVATKDYTTLSQKLDYADKLLYRAKKSGKNKTVDDVVVLV